MCGFFSWTGTKGEKGGEAFKMLPKTKFPIQLKQLLKLFIEILMLWTFRCPEGSCSDSEKHGE